MKLLTKYFKVVHELYDYFDYTSNGKILPIEDYTEFYWTITDKPEITDSSHCPGIIYFGDTKVTEWVDLEFNESIEAIYVGEEYTMFQVIYDGQDTWETGSLCVFDNKKQLKDETE